MDLRNVESQAVVWEAIGMHDFKLRIVQVRYKNGKVENVFEHHNKHDAMGIEIWEARHDIDPVIPNTMVSLAASFPSRAGPDLDEIRKEAVNLAKKEIVEKMLPMVEGLVSNQIFRSILDKFKPEDRIG